MQLPFSTSCGVSADSAPDDWNIVEKHFGMLPTSFQVPPPSSISMRIEHSPSRPTVSSLPTLITPYGNCAPYYIMLDSSYPSRCTAP